MRIINNTEKSILKLDILKDKFGCYAGLFCDAVIFLMFTPCSVR